MTLLLQLLLVGVAHGWNGAHHHHRFGWKATTIPPLRATFGDRYQEHEWSDEAADATYREDLKNSMLIIQRNNPSGKVPIGWRLATKEEAKARHDHLVECFSDWEICELEDRWKIDGPGYGGNIQKMRDGDCVSCQVISLATTGSTPAGSLLGQEPATGTGVMGQALGLLAGLLWSVLWSFGLSLMKAAVVVGLNNASDWVALPTM